MGSIQPELSYGIQESVLAFCSENYEAGVPVEVDGLICLFDTSAKEYKIIKIHTTFTKPEVTDQTNNKYTQLDKISQDSLRISLEEIPSIITPGTGNNSNEACSAHNLDIMEFIHQEDETNHNLPEREVKGSHARGIQCKRAKKVSEISNMNDIAPMQKSYMYRSTSCKSKQIHNEENSPDRMTTCGSNQQKEEETQLPNYSSACRLMIGMSEDSDFNCYEINGSERNIALRQNDGGESGIFHKNQNDASFLSNKSRNFTERRSDEIICKQIEAIGGRFESLSSLTSSSLSPGQQEATAVNERHTLEQLESKDVAENFHAIIKPEPVENIEFVESLNTEALSDAVGSYGKIVQHSAAQDIEEQLSPSVQSLRYRAWTHQLPDISIRTEGRSNTDSFNSGIETRPLCVPFSSRQGSCVQKSKQKASMQNIPSLQGPSANSLPKTTETVSHQNKHSKFNQQTTADKKRESGTHRYSCTKCGTCFMHRTNLRRHIAASCSSKRIKAPCSICGKLLLNRSDSLKRHIETVHYKKSSSLISLARTFI